MTSLNIDSDRVRDLPPSAKLVYFILQENAPLTQAELIERTALPGRTVRDALERLDDVGVLDERPYVDDARKNLYELAPGSERTGDNSGTEWH
ncbi:MarR family transcriptional regulator [Halorussus marinus]|uniref:MarR family transcriptional regulator n=1 Tax=Halorussus marinus TaxID=2505976 RepID=UPI001091B775|nr:helix-turn-helix domain-containing protein [Halorussus marinus]